MAPEALRLGLGLGLGLRAGPERTSYGSGSNPKPQAASRKPQACYHPQPKLPTVLERFRNRLTRASSAGDEGVPRSVQGGGPGPTFRLLTSLPGRVLMVISGLLVVVVGAQSVLPLPPVVELLRKILSL